MDNNTTTLMDAQGGLFSGSFNIERLKTFYTVMQMGSIYQASRRLGLSQPAVSRQITTLEQSLGVLLFHRGLGGVTPTRYGEILFETARKILEEATLGKSKIEAEKKQIEGNIRIATTVTLSTLWFPEILAEFALQYPQVKIAMQGSNQAPSLTVGETDILIWTEIEKHPSLIQEHLLTLKSGLYASKDYIKKYGCPQKPRDLSQHKLLSYSGQNIDASYDVNWALKVGAEKGKQHMPFMCLNNAKGLISIAEKGYGIAMISEPLYNVKNSNLVRVLPDYAEKKIDLFFTCTKNTRTVARTELLLQYLKQHISKLT